MRQVWAFAIFAAVLTVTPGLDTVLVLRTTATAGRRVGLASVVGIALGCVTWAVAGALGVSAVLSASRLAFEVLRIAGVAYLCWLGARALWQARRMATRSTAARFTVSRPAAGRGAGAAATTHTNVGAATMPGSSTVDPSVMASAGTSGSVGALRALHIGLTTNLLNPKVGVFYLSVMPQFLPVDANPLAGSLALGAIHVVEGVLWLSLVVLAVNRARAWLTRPIVRRRLEQLTGLALLGFGLRLALTSNPR